MSETNWGSVRKPLWDGLMSIRLLFVQYAGDYREAFRRFAGGGEETYYAQKYSVDAVAEIARKVDEAATLCCLTEEPYDEMLANGVRAIGAGFGTTVHIKELIKLIENYSPTHLVVRTPIREILRWAIQRNVKTITTLADSFDSKGLRNKIRNYQLANLLNHKQVDWVGNHGVNSSISLAKIGVKADKIVPWDWIHEITPASYPAKLMLAEKPVKEVIYVGTISEAKGVSDVLRAVSSLKGKGILVRLKVVGKGDLETYTNLAEDLQIEDCVEFAGLLPHKNIIPAMRKADIVVVPSRHEYPEGFPMTIYEALSSRTPIIASNHPMFHNKLIDQTNALIFPSGDSVALAGCIKQLISLPKLYASLSSASYDAWKNLQIPVKWADLINYWLSNSLEDQQQLFNNRLSSGRYGNFT